MVEPSDPYQITPGQGDVARERLWRQIRAPFSHSSGHILTTGPASETWPPMSPQKRPLRSPSRRALLPSMRCSPGRYLATEFAPSAPATLKA